MDENHANKKRVRTSSNYLVLPFVLSKFIGSGYYINAAVRQT